MSHSHAVNDSSTDESGVPSGRASGEGWGHATPEKKGLQPIPPGAMTPHTYVPALEYDSTPSGSHTPPASPNANLLGTPSPSRVQFASYSSDNKNQPWSAVPKVVLPGNLQSEKSNGKGKYQGWVPPPLRAWFWITLVTFMVLCAIGLEIALHFSKKNQGWPVKNGFESQTGFMHYVYTLPPVIVAMIFVTMWAWTDIEIKKMQPYVDLVHGDSPPHKSLLLDYTRTSNFFVWSKATANKHYLVALASLMALVALAFQPLAAALLTVKNTWWTMPDMTVDNLAAIGLNHDQQFQDLTSFLSAVGYASASVLYNLGDPNFIHDVYTVGPFELPRNVATNGTVLANTTAVKSNPGCVPADSISMQQNTDGSGWTNSGKSNGCTFTWNVDKSTTNLFGTSLLNAQCGNGIPDQFSPVVFWFFTYQPIPKASITFCTPTISLWDVSVSVDLASGNLTQVTELAPFKTGSSNFSSLSGNVTGPPLNGQAYNGIGFNLTNPDEFVLGRENATRLQMPAAVFQAAETSQQGLAAVFDTGGFVQLSNQVYTTYLKLIAKTVYFLPNNEPITVQVKTFRERLWLSDVAVHLLTAAMLILAFFGTIVHLFHRADRHHLVLAHEPGTIASAVSIGAQTNIGNILAGRQTKEDIIQALSGRKFRINPDTMKIIMEGEEGYEQAASPDPRKSFFRLSTLQSRRFSRQNPPASA